MNSRHGLWILLVLLWSFASHADPCGTDGTLGERIQECGEGSLMKLVMRDDAGSVIKMDDTGLLWGDLLQDDVTFWEATYACNNVGEADGYPTIDGVQGLWRSPTAEELAHIGRKNQVHVNRAMKPKINGNETWKELPNMTDRWYWSSSQYGRYLAWLINGNDGSVEYFVGLCDHNEHSVRCVADRHQP